MEYFKRTISFFAAALLSIAAFAQSFTVDGVIYHCDDGPASSGLIDIAGGRQGVATFSLEYMTDPDLLELKVRVYGRIPILSIGEDPDAECFPERIVFKDGSTLGVSGSCSFYNGDRDNTNSVTMQFSSFDCFEVFTILRSKDIKQINITGGKPLSLSKLGASSATVIDNLCRLMELEGVIPEGMPGKSPHHHWAIDKEHELEYSGYKYNVGDTLVVDGHKGIVFEVWSLGTHGKVISLEESPTPLVLFDGPHKNFGNTSYTDGRANAKAIKAISGWEKHFPALKWCTSLGPSWYLPASYESSVGHAVLEIKGIIEYQWDNPRNYNHSTYGYFSPIAGDLDLSDTPGELEYWELPTRAVAVF